MGTMADRSPAKNKYSWVLGSMMYLEKDVPPLQEIGPPESNTHQNPWIWSRGWTCLTAVPRTQCLAQRTPFVHPSKKPVEIHNKVYKHYINQHKPTTGWEIFHEICPIDPTQDDPRLAPLFWPRILGQKVRPKGSLAQNLMQARKVEEHLRCQSANSARSPRHDENWFFDVLWYSKAMNINKQWKPPGTIQNIFNKIGSSRRTYLCENDVWNLHKTTNGEFISGFTTTATI